MDVSDLLGTVFEVHALQNEWRQRKNESIKSI